MNRELVKGAACPGRRRKLPNRGIPVSKDLREQQRAWRRKNRHMRVLDTVNSRVRKYGIDFFISKKYLETHCYNSEVFETHMASFGVPEPWECDHIIPLTIWNWGKFRDVETFLLLVDLRNIMPLPPDKNSRKRGSVDMRHVPLRALCKLAEFVVDAEVSGALPGGWEYRVSADTLLEDPSLARCFGWWLNLEDSAWKEVLYTLEDIGVSNARHIWEKHVDNGLFDWTMV